MQKRKLGRSGIDLPPVMFGGNVFGWTADEATSFKLLDACVDGGHQRDRHRRCLFGVGARPSGR